jgi:hypothetical protein
MRDCIELVITHNSQNLAAETLAFVVNNVFKLYLEESGSIYYPLHASQDFSSGTFDIHSNGEISLLKALATLHEFIESSLWDLILHEASGLDSGEQ